MPHRWLLTGLAAVAAGWGTLPSLSGHLLSGSSPTVSQATGRGRWLVVSGFTSHGEPWYPPIRDMAGSFGPACKLQREVTAGHAWDPAVPAGSRVSPDGTCPLTAFPQAPGSMLWGCNWELEVWPSSGGA